MSTTSIAKDILDVYPDAYIGIDCADKIEFELNTTTVLPSTQVSQFVKLFGPNAACSVNLESKLVTISTTSVKFKKFPLLKSKLVATTESEKAAVQFADALNVIDFDYLTPEFSLESTDVRTLLRIRNLICINHNELMRHIENPSVECVYHFAQQQIVISFPKSSKRKR